MTMNGRGTRVLQSKRWLVVGVLLTPPCLGLALWSAGGGHGDYFWAKVLYPVPMLLAASTSEITTFSILLACIQLPFYGWILDTFRDRNRLGTAILVITVVHLVAVAASFLGLVPF
jgi:hypothetical protein